MGVTILLWVQLRKVMFVILPSRYGCYLQLNVSKAKKSLNCTVSQSLCILLTKRYIDTSIESVIYRMDI